MFFFNPGSNPLLAFLQGGAAFQGGMGGPLAPGNPFDLRQQDIMRAQMQQMAAQMGAQHQKNLMNAQAIFGGRGGIPPSVDPQPVTVELKPLKALPPMKDITPEAEFECAGCGHPGPKDRLNGCQVCGGMVWK